MAAILHLKMGGNALMFQLLVIIWAFLAWASPLHAQSPSAGPAALTLKDFAALPTIQDPELSPDGKSIAARLAINGQQYLVITPVFADGQSSNRIVGLGDNDLNWWRWVNDEWLVVGVGNTDHFPGGDVVYVTRVLGVSRLSGKKLNPLLWKQAGQHASDVLWAARDGSPRILLGIQQSIYCCGPKFYPEIFDVEVSTGKSDSVVKPQIGMAYYADSMGTVRMGYSRNLDHWTERIIYRSSGKNGFRTIARADESKGTRLVVPSLFLPETDRALAINDADGFDAVYEYDLSTLKLGRKLFGVDGYDIGGLIPTPGGDGLAGVAVTKERSSIHWMDPKIVALQASFDKAAGPGNAGITSWNQDQTKFLVFIGAADQAGGYYYYDELDGRLRLIGWTNYVLKGRRMAPVRTIRYKARDGLEIAAILTLPKGRPAKSLPLIVMPHGGPEARDSESWNWQAQYLADRGYAVVQPNYRGSTGFGAAFLEKGEGQWGLGMQDDLNDAIAHLAKEGIADPKRVCILGGSYGGYAAMRAAERDGALYRCAISFAGVSDLAALRRYDTRFLDGKALKRWLETSAPDFGAVSPIRRPEAFSIPILLVHGKKDLRVPVNQSREMAEKLRAAGKAVTYVEQPEGDHHFTREADRIDFLTQVEVFLAKHNPAD